MSDTSDGTQLPGRVFAVSQHVPWLACASMKRRPSLPVRSVSETQPDDWVGNGPALLVGSIH